MFILACGILKYKTQKGAQNELLYLQFSGNIPQVTFELWFSNFS